MWSCTGSGGNRPHRPLLGRECCKPLELEEVEPDRRHPGSRLQDGHDVARMHRRPQRHRRECVGIEQRRTGVGECRVGGVGRVAQQPRADDDRHPHEIGEKELPVRVARSGQRGVKHIHRGGRQRRAPRPRDGQVHGALQCMPHPGHIGAGDEAGRGGEPLEILERDGAAEGAHRGRRIAPGLVARLRVGAAIRRQRVGDGAQPDRPLQEDRQLARPHVAGEPEPGAVAGDDVHRSRRQPRAGSAVAEGDPGVAGIALPRGVDALGRPAAVEARRLAPGFVVDPDFELGAALDVARARNVGQRRARQAELRERHRRIGIAERLVGLGFPLARRRDVAAQGQARRRSRQARGEIDEKMVGRIAQGRGPRRRGGDRRRQLAAVRIKHDAPALGEQRQAARIAALRQPQRDPSARRERRVVVAAESRSPARRADRCGPGAGPGSH